MNVPEEVEYNIRMYYGVLDIKVLLQMVICFRVTTEKIRIALLFSRGILINFIFTLTTLYFL